MNDIYVWQEFVICSF